MAAIILTWNPKYWGRADWEPPYDEVVAASDAGEPFESRWNVGRRVNIPVDADAWLYLQGAQHGLVGRGRIVGGVQLGEHFTDPGRETNYVEVRFSRLVDFDDRIPREVLEAAAPAVTWRHIRGSGFGVAESAEGSLKALWDSHFSPVC